MVTVNGLQIAYTEGEHEVGSAVAGGSGAGRSSSKRRRVATELAGEKPIPEMQLLEKLEHLESDMTEAVEAPTTAKEQLLVHPSVNAVSPALRDALAALKDVAEREGVEMVVLLRSTDESQGVSLETSMVQNWRSLRRWINDVLRGCVMRSSGGGDGEGAGAAGAGGAADGTEPDEVHALVGLQAETSV
jgi:hypothetical protein